MLKVWLPLDGNLRNLGASNVEVVNNGATIDNNGKIGKCYSFTSGKYLQSAIPTNLKTKAISYTCWIYVTSWNTSWDAFMSIANGTGWTTSRATLCRNNTASTLTWNIADGNTSVRVSSITAINLNTWYHVACTYDGANLKIYINGNLDNSTPSTLSIIYAGTFNIGGWSGNNYPINGKLNDVRIYDHCLSAAEVHEIAMGLVLHYKLDLPNKNFCIGTNTSDINTNKWSLSMQTGGSTKEIIYDNNIPCVKITRDNTAQSGWRYFQYANLNVSALTPNTTYTISFDMKTSVDGTVGIVGFYNGNATNLITTSAINVKSQLIANQWNHVILRVTTIDPITVSSQVVYMSLSSSLYGTGVWMIMKNMKVEVGEKDTPWSPHPNDELFKTLGLDTSIITDSSGYGRNGIINGNPTISTDTLRYCTNMNFHSASVDYITIPSLKLDMANITFSVWAKWTAFNNWSRIFDFGETTSGTGYSILVANNGSNLYVGGRRAGGASLPDTSIMSLTTNTWYYITVTIIDTICKTYVNGTLVKTFTLNGNIGYADFNLNYLGKSNWSNDKMLDGYISDFRIYCTPLLDNDIKMLYNVGMKVDNLGGIHTFEFNENSLSSLKKQGILTNSHFSENGYQEILQYDKNIYTEPDGSTWIHIFHHNNPANGLFSSSTNWKQGIYLDSNRWYDIEKIIPNLIQYEFMVKQKTTSDAAEIKYRWIQNTSPLNAVYADVKPGTCTYNTASGYTNSSLGGLYILNSNTHFCIANNSNGNWYGAIGCWTVYDGGIPGYPNTTVTSGYIDLYARVYLPAKIIKNLGINAIEFIEI